MVHVLQGGGYQAIVISLSIFTCFTLAWPLSLFAEENNLFIDRGSDENFLSGTYEDKKTGNFITFELISRISDYGREEPDFKYDDQVEVDIRVFDRNGYVFMVQKGGDEYIDQSWIEDDLEEIDAEDNRLIDSNERMKAFSLVYAMRKAMLRFEANGELAKRDFAQNSPLWIALARFSGFAADDDQGNLQPDKLGEREFEYSVTEESNTVKNSKTKTIFTHRIRIYKKWRYWGFFLGVPVWYWHSGTKVWRELGNSGSTVGHKLFRGINCNHGSCPSKGMTKVCGTYWNNRTTGVKGTNNCTTKYSAISNKSNRHNCHDDSALQYADVRDNVWHNTYYWGRCHKRGHSTHAPSCN